MNRSLILISMLMTLSCSMSAEAASSIKYSTDLIESICSYICPQNKIPNSYNGKDLSWRVDTIGEVHHIGYKIFTDEQRQANQFVFDFIERYALQCDIDALNPIPVKNKLAFDRIEFENTSLNLLPQLKKKPDLQVLVYNLNGNRYRIEWVGKNGTVASMSFPIDHQLMIGCDIDELERRIPNKIAETAIREETTELLGVPTDNGDGTYTVNNVSYLIDLLTSARNVQIKDNQWMPTFDPEGMPSETLRNLFTALDIPNDYQLAISMRQYDKPNADFTVPLAQYVTYCLDNGCISYFGIISDEEDVVEAESVMMHPQLGYAHVMRLSVLKDDLANSTGFIKGNMVSYVPVSKITKLFDE